MVIQLFSIRIFAQNLTVPNGSTVTITSNTFYATITVQNGGTLNILAPATVTVSTTGTSASTQVVDFQNGSSVFIETGATLVVNGRLNNSNNSSGVVINGSVSVNGNVTGGNGSTMIGGGTLNSSGSITGNGTFFGNSNDCSTGPCSGSNLCSFSTSNTITASGTINHCNSTNTTGALNGSAITSATYQWQSSSSLTGTYSNITGANSQNYTPPTNLTSTTYYIRNATVSSCTQTSNVITVRVGATPLITTQPASSQTVCVGGSVSFSVTATGQGLTYQWRKGTTNISGATSSTYTIASVAVGDAGTNYNCLITSTCTAPNTSTTNNATLVVTNTALPTVTASVQSTFCTGGTIQLTGTRSGGTGSLNSVWTGPNGFASTSLSPTVVTNGATAAMAGTYTHTVSDDNSCSSSATASNSLVSMSLSQIPSSGLLYRYDFNGNANDLSGNANNGTLQNSPTITSNRLTQSNSAYTLNGSNQHITTATLLAAPNTFTINIWFNTTTASGGKLIGFGNQISTSSGNYDRHIYMRNSGVLTFGVWNGSQQNITSSAGYNDGAWHMATASMSSNGMKFYVDGVLIGSNAITVGSSYNGYWRMGFDNLSGWTGAPTSNFFNGTLDDVLIYNRELSSSEITTLFNNTFGVSATGVCQGGTLNINNVGISGATYSWTGPNSFTSTLQNPSVSAMNSSKVGLYTVVASLANCPTTANASLLGTINAALNPNLSQVPTSGLISRFDFTGNALDGSGNSNNGVAQGSPSLSSDRFGISNRAYTLNGTSQYFSTSTQYNNPSTFTISMWFNTTTTSGGRLIGFSSTQTGLSGSGYDRHIYMTNSGNLVMGIYNGSANTISTTAAYNDGKWHMVTASLSPSNGLRLYVDGTLVVSNASLTTAENINGWWRIGYDNLTNWVNIPSSRYFSGSIDEVLIYNRELSSTEVNTIYTQPTGASSPAVCNGGTLNISASNLAGASYSWTGPNSFTSSIQNPTVANMNSSKTGTYTLTVTASDGCISDPIYTLASINSALNPDMSYIPSSNLILNYVFNGNANDFSGNSNNGTLQNSPTLVSDRFLTNNAAYSFNGSNQQITTTTQISTPANFSISAWFRTTTTSGGKLVGYGSSQTGLSGSYDKHIYMTNAGNIVFGVYPGSVQTITGGGVLNDGNWHHVVASLSSTNGMKLYVDGSLVATNASVTTSQSYDGYWRIAYDNLTSWTNAPSSSYFNGSLDDIAIYNREISLSEVASLNQNSATGSNSPVCSGSPIFLTAKTISGATYSWTGPNSFVSTSQNPTIANAAVANDGTYSVTAQISSTGCTSDPVNVVVVVSATSINNNTISSAQTICGGGTPAALSGSTPTGGSGGFTYQWSSSTTSSSTGFSNIPSATSINYAPSSLSATTWFRRDAISNGCRNTTTSLEITIQANGNWAGGTSSSWNNSANWCGGIPTSSTDVIIPSGTSFSPTIDLPNATVRNITINSGATLTSTNNVAFNIYGDFVNNGTYTDNGANVSFLGSTSQGVTNMASSKNLTVNNSSGVVLNSDLTVTGAITLTSGTLNSSGRLTLNLSTGYIDPSGSGAISGNMSVLRNSSDFTTASLTSNYHYIGTPLQGATLAQINDDILLDNATELYGYYEGDGNIYIQSRWKSLVSGTWAKPLSTVMNAQLFGAGSASSMVGYCLRFNLSSPEALDITGTYTHSSGSSFTTGLLSYTDGGQAWGNGWHLISNPYPSYIDWNSAAVTKTNLERGITYYNSSTNQNADYLPAQDEFPEAFNNGGSPFIPAMQAFWVQVKPIGNGSVTVGNSARVASPNLSAFGTVPSFYRAKASSAQVLKFQLSDNKGSDETNIRFGASATDKFDGLYDIYKTSDNSFIPTLYTITNGEKYAVNSLPEISQNTRLNISLNVENAGKHILKLTELINFEEFLEVNLIDYEVKKSQNLKEMNEYVFNANKGRFENRFELVFKKKPELITSQNSAYTAQALTVSMHLVNKELVLDIHHASSDQASIVLTNVLGQEQINYPNLDVSGSRAAVDISSLASGVYIAKAIVDGQLYSKQLIINR
jgi:hypothetical protein